MKLERPLDAIEIRILGCLLEKQQTTPDYYPLTLNALRSACNQSTNRDPVLSLDDDSIESGLHRLQEVGLVWKVIGGRALRWDHNLDKRWQLDPQRKALITLLLLRGPQTAGELRTRAERMHGFESVQDLENLLTTMRGETEPLVTELDRRPGQKESRWTHLAGEHSIEETRVSDSPSSVSESLTSRVEKLELRIEELESLVQRLRKSLGED